MGIGFLLRKTILRYLKEAKILIGDGGIYEFPDDVVLRGLGQLSRYRHEVLNKKVKPVRQSGLTCSAACLAMIGYHFGRCALDESTEKTLAHRSGSRYIAGQHYSGLAAQALSMNLEVVMLHSSHSLFDNFAHFSSDIFEELMNEYRHYLLAVKSDQKARIETGVSIEHALLRSYLESDYLVMIAGQLGPDLLHSKLLVGYNHVGFLVIDPASGSMTAEAPDRVSGFMRTGIGKWALAIRPNQSLIEKLTTQLAAFKSQAEKHLADH